MDHTIALALTEKYPRKHTHSDNISRILLIVLLVQYYVIIDAAKNVKG